MASDSIRLIEYNTGRIWESEGLLRIGKLPAMEVCLDNISVSRRHAEISRSEGGSWSLRDLGSTNGTFINGHRIDARDRHSLLPGNLLCFGQIGMFVDRASFGSAAEWETCRCPLQLLGTFLPTLWSAPSYDRKLRLWAVACTRRCWGRVRYSYIVDLLGVNPVPDRVAAIVDLLDVNPVEAVRRRDKLHIEWEGWQADLLEEKGMRPFTWADELVIGKITEILSFGTSNRPFFPEGVEQPVSFDQEGAVQAGLLRCVLGNPWRQPCIDPAWLRWNGGAIPALANGIYAERSFGDLPVLADALEESGCVDEYLLGHLRSGSHCRGCHALDAVLGRHPPFPIPG